MSDQRMELVDLKSIVPSKTNPRKSFNRAEMKDLEDSIRSRGVLQPILIRPYHANYEIVCGERRYRAALAVGLENIPACIREMDDQEVLEAQLIENMQRSDVHPLEEAEGYKILMTKYEKYAENVDEIASKVGKSKSYIYSRLKLLELVPVCRKMFLDGQLTASVALLVARIPQELQTKAAKEIEGLSYRAAEEAIQRDYMLNLRGTGFAKDESICPERGSCASCTKRTGNQEMLFPDIKSADVCTDPACFMVKRQAYVQKQEEKARKTGQQVLKSETVFPYSDQVGNGFVELDESCPTDPAKRTYKEILAADPEFKPRLAVDSKGKIHEVVKRTDVEKALIGAGAADAKSKNAEKEKALRTMRETVTYLAMDQVMIKIKEDTKQNFWRVLAEVALTRASNDIKANMVRRVNPDVKQAEVEETITRRLKQMPSVDLPAFVCECLAWPSYNAWEDYGDAIVGLCEVYGIDMNAIEKDVKKLQAEEKKKEVKKGKTETIMPKGETKPTKSASLIPSKVQPDPANYLEITREKGGKIKVKMPSNLNVTDKQLAEAGLKKMSGLFGRK